MHGIRFSPMSVFRSLSLFFFLISYQTITLVWHVISLLSSGETLSKIKSWRSILHYIAPISFLLYSLTVLYCTARTVFIMIVPRIYIPYLFGSSPHRTAKQLFSAHILNFVLEKPMWLLRTMCTVRCEPCVVACCMHNPLLAEYSDKRRKVACIFTHSSLKILIERVFILCVNDVR